MNRRTGKGIWVLTQRTQTKRKQYFGIELNCSTFKALVTSDYLISGSLHRSSGSVTGGIDNFYTYLAQSLRAKGQDEEEEEDDMDMYYHYYYHLVTYKQKSP